MDERDRYQEFLKITGELKEEFDLRVRHVGGRATFLDEGQLAEYFEPVHTGFYRILESIRADYPGMPYVHFDYIANIALNGLAFKSDKENYFFVGLTLGTLVILEDVFLTILACNNTLTRIGNVSLETKEKKVFNLEIRKREKKNAIFDFTLKTLYKPNDLVRLSYAQHCYSLVIEFIMLHECCHILRGHVGYIKDKHKKDYNPLDESLIDLVGIDFCQTCEMDADSFAICRMIDNMFKKVGQEENQTGENHNFYGSYEVILFNIGFVMTIMTKITDLSFFKDESTSTHPPPKVRLLMILCNIETLILNRHADKISVENAAKKISEGLNSGIETWNIVTEWKYPSKKLIYEVNDYMNKILRNWNNVRPLIETFAFYRPLPPLIE